MVIITKVYIQQSAFTCCQFYNEGDISKYKNSQHQENLSKPHKVFPDKIYKLSFEAHLHQSKVKKSLNVNRR